MPLDMQRVETELDVAIIGGGLAGNLIARQLRRAQPHARIAIFEKATETHFKVGESTVELASNYLIRRLGLSKHLYLKQLPKNGLRFFFDNAKRDADLESMSEIGSVAMPYLPSFQIDRQSLETELFELNREAGVGVHRGARVSELTLSETEQRHGFCAVIDGTRHEIKSRWVVDASGRTSVIAKSLGLRTKKEHAISAVWGRFDGVADLDDFGSQAFRERVNQTSRYLSTTHFCYPGYWIWFIPLSSNKTSVGVVMERTRFDDAWRKSQGFVTWLRSHRACAQLLEKATIVDTMSLGQLAYGTKRYVSEHRWGLVGEASSFGDPLYSPGTDFIAVQNDLLSDLVVRDLRGESRAAVIERTQLYDAFLHFRFQASMALYDEQYCLLGSYELFNIKWHFDVGCYYDLWVEPYMRDQHLDLDYVRRELHHQALTLKVIQNFGNLFKRVEKELCSRGDYYRKNLHAFTGAFPTMECAAGLGTDESARQALVRLTKTFNRTRTACLQLLGDHDAGSAQPSLPMKHFLSGESIA